MKANGLVFLYALLVLILLGVIALQISQDSEPEQANTPSPISDSSINPIFQTSTVAARDAGFRTGNIQTATAIAIAVEFTRAAHTQMPTQLELMNTGGGSGNSGGFYSTPNPAQSLDQRIIIRDTYLSITVEDVEATISNINQMVTEMNGWIVRSNTSSFTYLAGEQRITGNIAMRVPSDRLDEAVTTIKNQALEVETERSTGQDVTNLYIDLSSRLVNLQTAETELRDILSSADSTEAIIATFNELTRVRGEIEIIKGQLQFYDQSAAYSLIEIYLEPPQPELTPTPTFTPKPPWKPGETLTDATDSAVDSVKTGVDVLIWALVYGVLVFIFLGLPALTIWYMVRRRNKTMK